MRGEYAAARDKETVKRAREATNGRPFWKIGRAKFGRRRPEMEQFRGNWPRQAKH